MAKEHILVIDDEEDILELVQFNLSTNGYLVSSALTGEEGLKIIEDQHPDLVLLDLMLPGMDGLEVFRIIRQKEETRDIPVIMLTARGEETDIVTGLEMGADDYITKPFSIKILLARTHAVLRRKRYKKGEESDTISLHGLVIHPGKREVLVNNVPVRLTYTEFEIMHLLARKPGWVFTRGQIVDAVRGKDYFVTDRSVDVQIVGLRKKLGDQGKYIETIRGIGYRLRE